MRPVLLSHGVISSVAQTWRNSYGPCCQELGVGGVDNPCVGFSGQDLNPLNFCRLVAVASGCYGHGLGFEK